VLHRIVRAKANRDFTVEISWEDGSTSTADFKHVVGRGVAAQMADPAYFAEHMSIGGDGDWLEWPGEVDFSADSLWYKAHPDELKRDYGDNVDAAE
jgi:hypothetical protein